KGVQSRFDGHSLVLSIITDPSARWLQEGLSRDLANAPDIAQTIAVSCFGLGLDCHLTGLHTLKIKETDRLLALENELTKFGAALQVTGDSLHLDAFKGTFKQAVSVATYHDHRMAMAFAPLALRVPMQIEDAMVVKKSYPDFWEDLRVLGFEVTALEK
ncbi:MAG: 3-phosphoshikimate 1-carboxyvinyltransferase, partial [Flavobacteriia bacterium]|nr:3-phosphoshikimate 1-carboxyvinyltransferase [Flavobacteriia bacterium]